MQNLEGREISQYRGGLPLSRFPKKRNTGCHRVKPEVRVRISGREEKTQVKGDSVSGEGGSKGGGKDRNIHMLKPRRKVTKRFQQIMIGRGC